MVSADYVLGVLRRLWELSRGGYDVSTRVDNDVWLYDYERGIEVVYYARSHGPPYKWRVRFDVRKPRVSEGLVYYLGLVFPYVEVLIDEGVYELRDWFDKLVDRCFNEIGVVCRESGFNGVIRMEFLRVANCCDPSGSWIWLGVGRKYLVYGGNVVAYTSIPLNEFREAVRRVVGWWRGGGKEMFESLIGKMPRRFALWELFP